MDERTYSTRNLAELITKVVTVFFGIAYISGYLIVFDHMESLGISAAGASVLKAKYIWIGYLYLFPFLFISAVAARLYLRRRPVLFWPGRFVYWALAWLCDRNPGKRYQANNWGRVYYMWLVIEMIFIIGVRMLFFGPTLRESTSFLLFLVLFSYFLHQLSYLARLAATNELAKGGLDNLDITHSLKGSEWIGFTCFVMVSVLCGLVILQWSLGYGLASSHWLMRWADWFLLGAYAMTVLTLHLQLFIAFRRDANPSTGAGVPDSESQQRARWVSRAVMILALFPASIHGFTHVVYPHIPVERGGAKYDSGAVVSICLRPAVQQLELFGSDKPAQLPVPMNFCPSGLNLADVIVLEEEPDTLYVASVFDKGTSGRFNALSDNICGVSTWHEAINSPKVLALSSASIVSVRDEDTVENFCRTRHA